MAVEESLQFNWFEIKSNLTDERIDLRAGIAEVEYRESIFSPYIELTAQLVDVGNTVKVEGSSDEGVGLLDAEIGEGTEEIIFEIQDNKGNKVSLANEDGLDLRVSSVTSIKQSFQNQSFTLTAVAKEAFDNTLLMNRCRKQYSGKISDLVESIVKTDLKSKNPIETDLTQNQYHEWGNERYPFEMILDLQKLAIPAELQTTQGKNALGQTAGYLFWQTSTGFKFKSIDKLFDTTDKEIKIFVESKKAQSEGLPIVSLIGEQSLKTQQADGKILYSYSMRSINALEQFESGARGSMLEVYNPNLPAEEQYSFNPLAVEINEEGKTTGNGVTGSRNLPIFNSEYKDGQTNGALLTTIERTRAAFSPVKGQETVEKQVESTPELNYDVNNIFQQTHQSYRQKLNVFREVIVEADLSLHAGDLVYCEFEEMSTKVTSYGSRVRESGIYMIADLCHYGNPTQAFTGLNLVRDGYGVKDLES